MIAVRIPKEIKAYKEKLVFGLTLRQLIATVIALGICVPLYVWGIKYINEEVLSWVIMFIALPCAGIGFFTFNGMPFEKFAIAVFKQAVLLNPKRKYKSENCFREWQNEDISEDVMSRWKRTKKGKRIAYEASLERSFLIIEAAQNGEDIDMDKLNSQLLTVSISGR